MQLNQANIDKFTLTFRYLYIILHVDAGWSSLVARRAHNPKVVGSNPAPATKFLKEAHRQGGPFAQWTIVFCAI